MTMTKLCYAIATFGLKHIYWCRSEKTQSSGSSSTPSGSPIHHQQQQQQDRSAEQRSPRCYAPDGRRFKVSGRHINWLDWQFSFNIRTTTGPIFHDMRFRGQRIIYELGLQVKSLQVLHLFLSAAGRDRCLCQTMETWNTQVTYTLWAGKTCHLIFAYNFQIHA